MQLLSVSTFSFICVHYLHNMHNEKTGSVSGFLFPELRNALRFKLEVAFTLGQVLLDKFNFGPYLFSANP
jgi:hypothetical protein